MPIEKIPTFCRVCEASCGLVAERENNTILSLRPDKTHPVTQGYACPKGILALDMHRDEDRLNVPWKRTNSRKEELGDFDGIDWDAAAQDIGLRLQHIIDTYGTDAVGMYIGNPTAFNSLLGPAIGLFARKIGCSRTFSSGTQDCTNKFAATEAVFGTATLHPIPDIENTDYLLIIGENPKISRMSFIAVSDPMAKIRAAKKRGAVIRYINPRKIESADDMGEVIRIKPDTDLYFLAAVLFEIERLGGFKDDEIAVHGKHIDGLKGFIRRYSPERVEKIVGIPAEVIRGIAREFSSAKKAAVHMSTGVNMGRQGTLTYWLVQMLSFATGNLDAEGGNYYALGFYPAAKSGRTKTHDPYFESPFGPVRTIMGNLPGNLMADMIDMEKDPIRALFVISGNPVLAIAGEETIRKAFTKLELLVVLDIYRNATAEMADFILPCADMLERADVNTCGIGLQYRPYAQFTEAVVPPRFERKEQWWILSRIEQAMGLSSVLDDPDYDPWGRLNKMLSHVDLSTETLKSLPHGTALLPESGRGRFYSDWLQTPDKKVDCRPVAFDETIQTAEVIFRELENEPEDQLKLITLRNAFMHNSWYHNLEKLKKGEHLSNPLYISPADAERKRIQNGGKVRMYNQWGSIEAVVRIDDRLREGVVCMAHGWGNQKTPGMQVARKYPGVNVNRLLPHGPGSYEKISNQAHMTGIPVWIDKI
ncbi:MAG: molybdopterin-dependent oxidoreductase [Desulfobacterales bacterium]